MSQIYKSRYIITANEDENKAVFASLELTCGIPYWSSTMYSSDIRKFETIEDARIFLKKYKEFLMKDPSIKNVCIMDIEPVYASSVTNEQLEMPERRTEQMIDANTARTIANSSKEDAYLYEREIQSIDREIKNAATDWKFYIDHEFSKRFQTDHFFNKLVECLTDSGFKVKYLDKQQPPSAIQISWEYSVERQSKN